MSRQGVAVAIGSLLHLVMYQPEVVRVPGEPLSECAEKTEGRQSRLEFGKHGDPHLGP